MIERSRFIATLVHAPTADHARTFMDEMRREFPDASHNCWAFVAGPPGTTAAVGMSDAGEPHGTAGRPMLDILLHSGIGEIAAVVTRYFGGVKLGKGGLVRAYGGSVQLAIATLPTIILVARTTVAITVGYADVEMLRRVLAEHDAEITAEEYGEGVIYRARVPTDALQEIEDVVRDATGGRAIIVKEKREAT